MGLLDEYLVGTDGVWSDREAGHLLRRAGFGSTPAERAAAAGAGDQAAFEAAVDGLVNFVASDPHLDAPGAAGTGTFGDPLAALPDDGSTLGRVKNPDARPRMEAHWAYRMRYSSQPLQEQFTLFLHDHMVSDWPKVAQGITKHVKTGNDGSLPAEQRCTTGTLPPDPNRKIAIVIDLLMTQNYLLRTTGMDDFRRLLLDITRDPAMLIYLDNARNKKGKPQENYGREVMELFSMGVDNYSEDDVREIAKCFTGEGLPFTSCSNGYQYNVHGFSASRHERGDKTVFGKTVTFDDTGLETEAVIDLILDEVGKNPDVTAYGLPAAAVYMSWKLLRWFVNQDIVLYPEPAAEVIELATFMNGSDGAPYPQRRYRYDMRAVMRKILLSKFFHAPENFYNMVKNPADFVMTALRGLELDEEFDGGNPHGNMEDMGMRLFGPPNVAGWNHGNAWVNSGTLIERFNYGHRMGVTLLKGTSPHWNALLQANGGPFLGGDQDADDVLIDYFAERLLHIALTPGERTMLQDLVAATPGRREFRYKSKVRSLIHVILSMPRYQLK